MQTDWSFHDNYVLQSLHSYKIIVYNYYLFSTDETTANRVQEKRSSSLHSLGGAQGLKLNGATMLNDLVTGLYSIGYGFITYCNLNYKVY